MVCTVGGIRKDASGLTSVTVPSDRLSAPSSNKACTVSSMKNGVPSVVSMMSCFNGRRSIELPENCRQHFIGAVLFQRLEPQQMAAGLVSPAQPIFGPVIHQEQNPLTGHLLHEQVEKSLALVIQPMQILDHQNERALPCFTQEQTNDGVERARSPELRVHAGEALFIVLDLQQRIEIGEGGLERCIQVGDPFRYPVPPRRRIVSLGDSEIAMQQLDHRQVRRPLAVRDRGRLEDRPVSACLRLEFEDEPRLSHARFGHEGDKLSGSGLGELRREPEDFPFLAAPNEFGESTSRRPLQSASARGPKPATS